MKRGRPERILQTKIVVRLRRESDDPLWGQPPNVFQQIKQILRVQ